MESGVDRRRARCGGGAGMEKGDIRIVIASQRPVVGEGWERSESRVQDS